MTLRNYQVFDIQTVKKAERWSASKIATVVKVKRKSVELRTGKESAETRLLHLERKRQNERVRHASPRSLASGSQ